MGRAASFGSPDGGHSRSGGGILSQPGSQLLWLSSLIFRFQTRSGTSSRDSKCGVVWGTQMHLGTSYGEPVACTRHLAYLCTPPPTGHDFPRRPALEKNIDHTCNTIESARQIAPPSNPSRRRGCSEGVLGAAIHEAYGR